MTLIDQLFLRPDAAILIAEAQNRLQDELERRKAFYRDIKPSIKAEFINGEVKIHSPVRLEHNQANGFLYQLLSLHVNMNDLGFVGIEKILIQCSRNDYEPDLCFFNNEKAKHFTDDQMFFPPPDLVVEVISKSTERIDRKIKFQDYAAHSVYEYWIVTPNKKAIEQYRLENFEYKLVKKHTKDDLIICLAIPNLQFKTAAAFSKKENIKAMVELIG